MFKLYINGIEKLNNFILYVLIYILQSWYNVILNDGKLLSSSYQLSPQIRREIRIEKKIVSTVNILVFNGINLLLIYYFWFLISKKWILFSLYDYFTKDWT